MAKNNRGDRRNAEAQYNELDSAASAWRRINDAKARGQQYDEAALRYLEQQYQTIDRLEGKIEDIYEYIGNVFYSLIETDKEQMYSKYNIVLLESEINSINSLFEFVAAIGFENKRSFCLGSMRSAINLIRSNNSRTMGRHE